jgi:uncharacterized protein (TIRG00374 family)
MRRLLRPSVVLPLILGVAVLAGLLAFSNVGTVAALMAGFRPRYLVYFVLLILVYEAVRCTQWHFMLRSLGVDVPLRTQVFTFATGEVTKDLPVGNFVPDYLLQSAQGTDFGLASAATLMITLIEVTVSLVIVVVIGIAGWGWLRPLILIGTGVFALLVWGFELWYRTARGRHRWRILGWITRWEVSRGALEQLRQFVRGEAKLLRPRVLAIGSALSATYMTLGGAGVYVVARGLGLERVGFWQVVAVYCFSVAFAAIVPLPMDFGSIEVSGTGALVAVGLGQSAAVGLILLNRLLSVGVTLALAPLVWLILRNEARAALGQRRSAQPAVVLTADERAEDEAVREPVGQRQRAA